MCTSTQIIGSLLVLSVLEIGLGLSSVAVGAVTFIRLRGRAEPPQLGDSSPVWSGACVRSPFHYLYFTTFMPCIVCTNQHYPRLHY